jgi:hypothetical protein
MHPTIVRFILSFSTPAIFLLLLCLVTGVPLQTRASTGWTQIGTTSLDYGSFATSDTGEDVIYGDYNGDVWLSNDYGASFADTLSELGDSWNALAMSSDGQTIVAAQGETGYIWYTKNGGIGWSKSNSTSADWIAVTMTSDGEHIAAITDDSSTPVAVSNDGGDTWQDAGSLPNENWGDISYSEDGSQLVVTSSDDPGIINVSNDYGADWHAENPPVSDVFGKVAAGDGGKILLASEDSIYESHNGGASWTLTNADGSPYGWSSLNLSYDGQSAFASPWSGLLTLSSNGGVNWETQDDPGVDGWNKSAISGDGTHLYAAAGETGIWRYGAGEDTTPPVITILGNNPINVTVGASYADAGATASDDADGDVTSSIDTTSEVNTAVAGSYTITYVAHDSSGNYATSTRAVNVTQSNVSGNGSSGGASITQQISTLIAMGKTALAQHIESQWPQLFSSTTTAFTQEPSTQGISQASPFARDLMLGATGSDVKALQQFLNAHSALVAKTGPGSAGDETTYFGVATKEALITYQKANGITPTSGYFGPLTRAYIATHQS